MYPKPPSPGLGLESLRAAKSVLRRTFGAVVALTVLGVLLSVPTQAMGGSPTVFPIISPQLVASSALLLPDQPVAPQPEAVPPALTAAVSASAHTGPQLADTGFHAIWLLPLAGGLVILGVLFALFASRKQRRDEELLVAEQAELARQAALDELADRAALSELEEIENLDRATRQPETDDGEEPPGSGNLPDVPANGQRPDAP